MFVIVRQTEFVTEIQRNFYGIMSFDNREDAESMFGILKSQDANGNYVAVEMTQTEIDSIS